MLFCEGGPEMGPLGPPYTSGSSPWWAHPQAAFPGPSEHPAPPCSHTPITAQGTVQSSVLCRARVPPALRLLGSRLRW